jgi:hypothetical protein
VRVRRRRFFQTPSNSRITSPLFDSRRPAQDSRLNILPPSDIHRLLTGPCGAVSEFLYTTRWTQADFILTFSRFN